MAKTTELLTDTDCRNATCPEGLKRRRLNDGGGLYLEVAPNGSKRWFWKFYPDGKESRLALGRYPAVTLKKARQERDAARQLRQGGTNPVQARRVDKLTKGAKGASTFETVARELHETKRSAWSDAHAAQWLRCLEKDLFPWLGSLPLADITAPMLLEALRKVQSRGAIRMAHDLREYAGQVFRFGIATGRAASNPAPELRDALTPYNERHVGAVLDPTAAGELLRSIDGYQGQPLTRGALLLSALVFQRPGNVRMMEWCEVDLARGMWTIPAEKMKRDKRGKTNGRPHFVPLAPQAVAVLLDLQKLSGSGRYVFPSILSSERPMSENTVRCALRRMGYDKEEMTAHGFRAMARTLMTERLHGINPEVVEAQLAHGKSGPLGAAYDRAEYMEARRQMMATWADYLDQLRAGAQVIPIRA